MKKVLLLSCVILFGCKQSKYIMSSKEYAESEYSVSGKYVYENDTVVVAEMTNIEFELYRGYLVKEISLTLRSLDADGYQIIRYLHTRDPRIKLEINTDYLINSLPE